MLIILIKEIEKKGLYMSNTYKVRIHVGRMDTRYGVDVANQLDDPISPAYKEDEVIEILMGKLGYTPADDKNSEYPGYYDDIGAYFDYDGYIDVDIPETIIQRIIHKVRNKG